MKRASFYTVVAACVFVAAAVSSQQPGSQPASPPTASQALDHEFFKAKVQPVFLARREGHARCVVCHTFNNAPFKLVPLSPGSTTWNEQQSRMNFELVKRVAMPGFLESKLINIRSPKKLAGIYHTGEGQRFPRSQDPLWWTLKAL